MLVRNHLLCPYVDCAAHYRRDTKRMQVLVDEKRNVVLNKESSGKRTRTRLPYLYKHWIVPTKCPHRNRPIEVVIDETHDGRNIYLRLLQKE